MATNLLDQRSELRVLLARLQEADDGLRRNLGGLEGVGLAAGNLLLADNDRCGHKRDVAVDVRAEVAASARNQRQHHRKSMVSMEITEYVRTGAGRELTSWPHRPS